MAISALNVIRLVRIERNGTILNRDDIPGRVQEVCRMAAEHFEKVSFCAPWVGYVAFAGEVCVGTCAFKTAPVNGEVEIAYATFDGYRDQGYATAMVEALIELANTADPNIAITAQTLLGDNASTRVLTKAGFVRVGDVMHPEDGLVSEWRLL
ncbi:MAG TPA: GNAT family N-acetyltransferase [Verrucomicrobiae bacterium]|nr:GNAT family N-acetyltransferase [Verrucomicrobiae bacterium]